jgi:hypothetical protein
MHRHRNKNRSREVLNSNPGAVVGFRRKPGEQLNYSQFFTLTEQKIIHHRNRRGDRLLQREGPSFRFVRKAQLRVCSNLDDFHICGIAKCPVLHGHHDMITLSPVRHLVAAGADVENVIAFASSQRVVASATPLPAPPERRSLPAKIQALRWFVCYVERLLCSGCTVTLWLQNKPSIGAEMW